MKLLILLVILSTSCGTDNKAKKTADAQNSPEDHEAVTSEDKAKNDLHSMALEKRDSLPECSEDLETALAYIKSEKLFLVCESGAWVDAGIEQPEERLPAGVFVDNGKTYFFSMSTQAVTNPSNPKCPKGFNPSGKPELQKLLDSGVLFANFPELEVGSHAICLPGSGDNYVTSTKGLGSLAVPCKVLCEK